MTDIHAEKILILDFGSQYTQLIARRVREAGVYSEIRAHDITEASIKAFNPKAIILSGGPQSATQSNGFYVAAAIFSMDVPILGICYGMQVMAAQLGGKVAKAKEREFGHALVRARGHSVLLEDIADATNSKGHGVLNVWMSHGDRVETLPSGFKVIASTDNAPIAGIADETRGFYGLQFHPEVTHTTQGQAILRRFLHRISGCQSSWNTNNIIADTVASIKQQVGDDRVLLALSGGVDSSVLARLLHEAIGKQLTCIFVDNGLLRLNESEQMMANFSQKLGMDVIRINAETRFLKKLKGITDPEEKRRIIGHEFISIFEQASKKIERTQWLAQGTIYPDVIESGGKNGQAKVIKSHHNVGGLPKNMSFKLLEPLKTLFKDEVRQIGVVLGLPRDMIDRHPFPGPGLGVRILGEVTKKYIDLLRLADDIFIKELRRHNLYNSVSQAFVVFLPIKSVGVTGDNRHYQFVVSLRAVETIDFMTARWANLPYEFLCHVSNRIINEIPNIARVTYDISGKPPATIEWE